MCCRCTGCSDLDDGVVGSHKIRDGLRHLRGVRTDCDLYLRVRGFAPTRVQGQAGNGVRDRVGLALLMGTPSTVSDASVPVAPLVKASPLFTLVMVRSLAAPELLLTIARRAPLESLTSLRSRQCLRL